MNSSQALAAPDWPVSAGNAAANANDTDPTGRVGPLQAELAALEPVVGAAVLVATAFRMRDEQSLIDTLRLLTQAVLDLEQRRAREEG